MKKILLISTLIISVAQFGFADDYRTENDPILRQFLYGEPMPKDNRTTPKHEDNYGTISPKVQHRENSLSLRVLNFARDLTGGRYRNFKSQNKKFLADCSGFILYIFDNQGINLIDYDAIRGRTNGGVAAIYYSLLSKGAIYDSGTPSPGDIVFFNNSFDHNRDGKLNDSLTHIGIVESVESDGTVHFIHHLNPRLGVRRDSLNLKHKNDRSSNSVLGVNGTLTGQLFAGYGKATAY